MVVAVITNSTRTFRNWVADNRKPGEGYVHAHSLQSVIGYKFDRIELLHDHYLVKEEDEIMKYCKRHFNTINIKEMRHVEKALLLYNDMCYPEVPTTFIELENIEDVKGVAPKVSFTVQSDPISEVGVNGVQALDLLKYTLCLFKSLNEAFPCKENACSITKMEEAIHWQEARTRDRIRRNVEGQNKA
jgi:hypothetical protein